VPYRNTTYFSYLLTYLFIVLRINHKSAENKAQQTSGSDVYLTCNGGKNTKSELTVFTQCANC